jgi:hypothetical protein
MDTKRGEEKHDKDSLVLNALKTTLVLRVQNGGDVHSVRHRVCHHLRVKVRVRIAGRELSQKMPACPVTVRLDELVLTRGMRA